MLLPLFRKNKLIRLPVQRKKRLIVLQEFVKKFRKGRKYSEQEVNDIITKMYDDYCQIRRRMVEEGIMKRKNQIYELVKENVYGE